MKKYLGIMSLAVICGCHAKPMNEWDYLDNGQVRIGVDRSRGACIGFFGKSGEQRNLLNHYDEGRFIQQSYYGQPDGSDWNGKPWVYNPIQGGSWQRVPAKVHAFEKADSKMFARIEPRHWANGELCPEMKMEQTITLEGELAVISFYMAYEGQDQGKPRHQEVPAVFIDGELKNFFYEKEGTLTTEEPRILAENDQPGKEGLGLGSSSSDWVAYLDNNQWGVGIYTPGTTDFTVYRALGDGTTGETGSACSYVAPLRTFALTKGMELRYEVYLTIGTLDEIKVRFEELKRDRHP